MMEAAAVAAGEGEGGGGLADGIEEAAVEALGRAWVPLSTADYAVLAFGCTWQAFALVVCLHLFWNRKWPPYVTKNVTLVIITVRAMLARYLFLQDDWSGKCRRHTEQL